MEDGFAAKRAIKDPRVASNAQERSLNVYFAVVACVAFGLYWTSSFILHARGMTMHFGADTAGYAEFAHGSVFARMATTYDLDRIMRFHLTTAMLAAGWMTILAPLARWIAPLHLLKAMFALVGAAGVWAAMSAFATVVPRRSVVLFGISYTVSFSVWYFSSIEESKIVSATLATAYIAIYLHLRTQWSTRGALLLTGILLLACLNEMVAGFLVVIPIVDTLVQRGWDWRHGRWIAAHALVGPLAFMILEGFAYLFLTPNQHPEGASHQHKLLYYLSRGYHGAEMLYLFIVNWLFYSLAARRRMRRYGRRRASSNPLSNYLTSPFSAGLVILSAVAIAVAVAKGKRIESMRAWAVSHSDYSPIRSSAPRSSSSSTPPNLFSSAIR